MKVLKNVNLHLKYVTRCFRNQMEKKSRTSAQFKKKKNDGHSSRHTQNEQLGKWLINYYCLAAKVNCLSSFWTTQMFFNAQKV